MLKAKQIRRDDNSRDIWFNIIPRVAGFIILSLKGLRRDEISCGVYGHVYLSVRLVYAGNDVTRPRDGGLTVWGAEKLISSGLRSCKVFFFPPFSFLFFFLFESWAFPWAFPFFRFSFWIKITLISTKYYLSSPSGARRRRFPMLLSFVLLFLIPSNKCPKCDYPIISRCFWK